MNAEILSIGTEVTRGTVVDTNAAWLADALSTLAVDVRYHSAVSDDAADIDAALRTACGRVDLVLVTGGLGPTADDMTREAVARVSGRTLVTIPAEVDRLRDFFTRRNLSMPEQNLRQAMVPEGARVLINNRGTACGFALKLGGCLLASMPGVPHEMKAMYTESVLPLVRARLGDPGMAVIEIQTYGLGESTLAERLGALMDRGANPDVGTRVQLGTITVRVIARRPTAAAALALAEKTAAEIEARLGEVILGRGNLALEDAVAGELEQAHKTIAIAESCTGGLMAALLTNVSGISRFFLQGVVAYSNEAKEQRLNVPHVMLAQHGAVSAEVAAAMARGVRETSGADIGVGITGIAGPTGGSAEKPVGLVYVAVADADGVDTAEPRWGGDRDTIRQRAARAALNLVRLRLRRQREEARTHGRHRT